MAGNITKRGENRWQVKVFLGRDADTGKQKFHNKTINGTKKDAQAYLNKVLYERDRGVWVEPSTMLVGDYLDRWVAEVDTSRSKTREYNTWVIGKYIKPAIGGIQLGRLSAFDIQGLYNSLTSRGLAPSSVRRFHNLLSSALRTAQRMGLAAKNPAADAILPKVKKVKMKVLDAEQARRFLAVAQHDRYSVLWALAIETGLRPEEYLGLTWADLDLREGVIMLQRVLHWLKDGSWRFEPPKTDSGCRRIRLSGSLIDLLICHRQAQNAERQNMGPAWLDLDFVFPAANGGPFRRENLTKRHFKPLLRAAGLPEIRLYDLRHTSATLLLLEGVHVKVVSERLGHADVTLTLNTYSHVLPDMQRDATVAIGGLLHGSSGNCEAGD